MTWPDSEVNSFEQSVLSWVSGVLARLGISLRAWVMQFLKAGGSLGTITGAPGFCAAWLLAATYIQWLNAAVVIGLPATEATEFPGTPLPQPPRAAATTKKAPSARSRLHCIRIASGG